MAAPVNGFTIVKRKSRNRSRYQRNCDAQRYDDHDTNVDVETVKTKVHSSKRELKSSLFYKDFQDAWNQSRASSTLSHLSEVSLGSSSVQEFVSPACTSSDGPLEIETGQGSTDTHECYSAISNNSHQDISCIQQHDVLVEPDEFSNCQNVYNNCTCTDSSLCSLHLPQHCASWENVSPAVTQVNLEQPCAEATRAPAQAGVCSHCGMSFNSNHQSNDDKRSDSTARAKVLICYGLGRFSCCVTSRYQFSLLLLLQEYLQIEPDHCFLYDPVFSEAEQTIIQDQGFQLIQENEECKHWCCSHVDTLFYMPHCGKAMYNNLVWANWSLQALRRVVIIGNSFHAMVDSMLERHAIEEISYIFKMYDYVNEVPVQNSFQYTDVFNDHSIHSFPEHTLGTIPDKLWTQCDEPSYSGSQHEEIIRKMINT